ncbi:MAG: citrate synthase family protein [Thermoleophilia bacterium]
MSAEAIETFTADQAAEYLGVTRGTLYSYASRGLVVSLEGPGPSRSRRYLRESLDAFLDRRERNTQRDLAALGALEWGRPLIDSQLCLIDDGRLYYRGEDAIELSRGESVERVAALLWTGTAEALPPPGWGSVPISRGGRGQLAHPAATPPAAPVVDRLARHLLDAAAGSIVTPAAAPEVIVQAAWGVLDGLYAAAGAVGEGSLAERLAAGWGTERVDDLRAALVLCADHELNISSFTARCVASADARVEQALLAALCALRGRRHGGATERAGMLLDDAARDGAAAAAERALTAGGALPGFGHPLYPHGDPRATELLDRCGADAEDGPVGALVDLVADQLGLAPNLDLGVAALARSLGLPDGAALGVFALGRSVGWIAHAIEAGRDGRLIRPRSRYTGPPPERPPQEPPPA